MTEIAAVAAGRWRDLLGPRNLGAAAVLAGGVALYATNEFLTISLMPSAVADIGGRRFYSWVTTVYLVGSVVAATTVSTVLTRWGPRRSYLMALSMFGVGSLGCALARWGDSPRRRRAGSCCVGRALRALVHAAAASGLTLTVCAT